MDCDAAIGITLGTQDGEALRGLMIKNEEIISTSYLHAELASALTKYVRAGLMDKDESVLNLKAAADLVHTFIPLEENITEAMIEGIRLGHSPYDMLYFTLARRNGATLYTLDRKLIDLCDKERIDCIYIYDLDPNDK
jgi:predicted nucleic acid-binding protein